MIETESTPLCLRTKTDNAKLCEQVGFISFLCTEVIYVYNSRVNLVFRYPIKGPQSRKGSMAQCQKAPNMRVPPPPGVLICVDNF